MDPEDPGRMVRVTFREYSEGRVSGLWPNAEFDRAEVSLDRGALDVDANGLGSGSFRVSSPTTNVEVSGTRFRAEHNPQTHSTRVSVEEGSVVATPMNSSFAPVTLAAGQQVDVGAAAVGPVESSGSSPPVPGGEDYGDDVDDEDDITVIGGLDGEYSEDLPEDFPGDFSEGDTGEFFIGDLDELITMLKSPDPGSHLDAGMAITEMGEDAKGAIPALLGLLGNSDSMSRLAGLIGLTGTGPVPEALAALPEILPLLEDPESMIRGDAAIYLGELGAAGNPQQKRAVRDALRGLHDDPSEEGALEYLRE